MRRSCSRNYVLHCTSSNDDWSSTFNAPDGEEGFQVWEAASVPRWTSPTTPSSSSMTRRGSVSGNNLPHVTSSPDDWSSTVYAWNEEQRFEFWGATAGPRKSPPTTSPARSTTRKRGNSTQYTPTWWTNLTTVAAPIIAVAPPKTTPVWRERFSMDD